MGTSSVILLGSAIYILALLGVGIYASRNVASSEDYVVAGRRLPLSLTTFTLFATWFGAGTCIGAAGAAYADGLLGVIADPFGAGLCLLLAGMFYVRFLRRMRLLTMPDFFRRRFGETAELLASLCLFPPYIGWVASQFVAFGIILHTLTGVDTVLATIIGAVVVLVYTVAGGMWAVTLTDLVQGIVVIVGLLILVPFALSDVGGFSGLEAGSREGALAFFPEGGLLEWLWYLQAWLVIGIGNIPGQDLMQRALSAKNERTAQWSSYLAGLMYITVGMLPVLVGLVGAVLIPELQNPEHILPELGLKYLHPVLMALFVGALLSAIMSSADSGLLAPASVFGENILKRLKPSVSPSQQLASIRWAVIVTGAIALVVALYFQRVYDLMVNSWSVLMVSLFVPLTAGLYWKRTNGPAAVASLVVGVVSWLVLVAYQDTYPADLMATALAAVTLVVVTWLSSKRHPATQITDIDGQPLEYRDRLGLLRPKG